MFQSPNAIKVSGDTAKSKLRPALTVAGDKFLTTYLGEGGTKLYYAWAPISSGAVNWSGNKQIETTGHHKLESHRAPGVYWNLFGGTPGIVYISTDQKSINQTISPFAGLTWPDTSTWSDPQPLSNFHTLGLKWSEIYVSTCGWQTFVIAVDEHGGVWFSAQATWIDLFGGGSGTTSWTNAQRIATNAIVRSGERSWKFDCWSTAVCTVTDQTGKSTPVTALYGFCPNGIAVFRIGSESIDEVTNTLTIGPWTFLKFVPIPILSASACTFGTGTAPSHALFFIDTSPGGLLTVDVNPLMPNFFQNPLTALKPGEKFSTDAVPGAAYFSTAQQNQFGLALVWKGAGENDLYFSSELI